MSENVFVECYSEFFKLYVSRQKCVCPLLSQGGTVSCSEMDAPNRRLHQTITDSGTQAVCLPQWDSTCKQCVAF